MFTFQTERQTLAVVEEAIQEVKDEGKHFGESAWQKVLLALDQRFGESLKIYFPAINWTKMS